jgi:hypothetical protein
VLDESVIRLDVSVRLAQWARIFSAIVVHEDPQTLVIAAARRGRDRPGACRGVPRQRRELRIALDITLARTIRVAFARWKTGERSLAGPAPGPTSRGPPRSRGR